MKKLLICLLTLFSCSLIAQETFPKNGVADQRDGLYAFTNATIYKTYNQKLENATLIIRKGKVEAIGAGIAVPQDAVIIDCMDKVIYPSFIDIYSSYGVPEVKSERKRDRKPQMLSDKEGAYSWNEALHPEIHAYKQFTTDEKSAKKLRKLGFGAVVTHQMDGISRGTSALVALGDDREHELILKTQAAHHLSFRKGKSSQNYPSSLMGSIALLRQLNYDAKWYANTGKNEELNISLEAWNEVQNLPQIFEVRDWQTALRADKVGDEFGKQYILKTSGDSYKRLNAIKASRAALIVPLNFPAAFDVEDPLDALLVDMDDMKHWELAPSNAGRLAAANIDFAFTMHGLKDKKEFYTNLRKAIKHGLSEEAALKALTHTPAMLIGAGKKVGSLQQGSVANFIISSANIFDKKAKILHNWVNGQPHIFKDLVQQDVRGEYQILLDGDMALKMTIGGTIAKPDAKIPVNDSTNMKVNMTLNDDLVSLAFKRNKAGKLIRLTGVTEGSSWSGRGQMGDGKWITWRAKKTGEFTEKEKDNSKDDKPKDGRPEAPVYGDITYPFTAYGWTDKPKQEHLVFRNVTVWTNEKEGILKDADVVIQNGKIMAVGQNLNVRGATEIDGTGKHLTCGIIDEHSHIAISRGVNEGTQASSAEVSIADVVNSEDVNLYRQLAGGVTTAQLLHGSANPIGGQSAIIKFRWGWLPEDMKMAEADPFIKFALGENVKQSNWGDNNTVRFPQTRMGVEQVFDDYFSRAKTYGELKRSGKPYRVDLDLETVLQIIESERFITCHSYRQSEITMLMRMAEKHGFRINTFTHILEGYKVADKMAEHGVAGSTFSDWWAYKWEVIDAIPANGSIMQEQGVLTAFNSDDAEMARRLNQEAAKAIKYGGTSEEEAWKFVTLNPAKILHIDNQVGSVKVGKDADIVLWSDYPMSIYAKAEMTFVDGYKLFDRAVDLELRKEIQTERARLIQKMLDEKKSGGKMQAARGKHQHHYHCDDIHDEMK